MTAEEQFLRRAYDAFNARDIEAALALMHPDVDWPNAIKGGRELGRDAVRDYWTRQFGLIDSHVEPLQFATDDRGRVVVDVHAVVRDLDGNVVSDKRLQHVYTLHEGLIQRMDVRDEPKALPG